MAAKPAGIMEIEVPAHVPPELIRSVDLFTSPEVQRDPFGFITKMHDGPRVFWNTINPRHGGAWMLTRAEEIRVALNTPDKFASTGQINFSTLFGEAWPMIPLELDQPDHRKYRMMMNPWFTPAKMEALSGKVRSRAARLIDAVADKGATEFMHSFGEPFPIGIFVELMGLPEEQVPLFLEWEQQMVRSPVMAVRVQAARNIVDYLRGWIAERRKNPTDDLASLAIKAELDGKPIGDDAVLGICVTLFLGGLDTVASSLGFHFMHLAQHHDLQQRLRDEPSRIKYAVEEFLRAYAPVTSHRQVTEDLTLGGVEMKKGDWVVFPYAAANLDPTEFANPAEVDIDRKNNRHVTFAFGPHFCIGSHLARRELNIAIEEWLLRVPTFRIEEGADVRFRGGGVLQVENLPLVW